MALRTQNTNRRQLDRQTILEQEGVPYTESNHWPLARPATNQQLFPIVGNFGKNRVLLNHSGFVSCDKDVELYFGGSAGPGEVYPGVLSWIVCPGGTSVRVDFKTPLGPNLLCFIAGREGAEALRVGCHFSGVMVTNDLNFGAKRKILFIGDSIADGTVDNMDLNQYYTFMVRDWLSKNSPKKEDFRLVLKAWGGYSSTQIDKMIHTQTLYVDAPDVIFYQMGVNDAAGQNSTAAYEANLAKFIEYKKTVWPNAILVMVGITPAEQNARNTTHSNYRNVMANLVTATADPKIKFVSLQNAFDRTAASGVWAASDGAPGDRIHPGTVAAQAGMANAITAGLADMNIFNLLPAL